MTQLATQAQHPVQQQAVSAPVPRQDLMFDVNAMAVMNNVATTMAKGGATVPQHLKGNQADCLAVVMQAVQWGMNPFSVAQKTHFVQGSIGYEAQLVNAVVSSSRAIVGGFQYEWYGPWERVIGKFREVPGKNGGKPYKVPAWNTKDEEGLGVRVWAVRTGESEPQVLELLLTQAQVRNSTLWASDPKQQLAYLAVKRWARLYAPAVLMGVYTPDELSEPQPSAPREVNPDFRATKTESRIQEVLNDDADVMSDGAVDFLNAIEGAGDLQELQAVQTEIQKAVADNLFSDSDKTHLTDAFKRRKQALTIEYARMREEQASTGTEEQE